MQCATLILSSTQSFSSYHHKNTNTSNESSAKQEGGEAVKLRAPTGAVTQEQDTSVRPQNRFQRSNSGSLY